MNLLSPVEAQFLRLLGVWVSSDAWCKAIFQSSRSFHLSVSMIPLSLTISNPFLITFPLTTDNYIIWGSKELVIYSKLTGLDLLSLQLPGNSTALRWGALAGGASGEIYRLKWAGRWFRVCPDLLLCGWCHTWGIGGWGEPEDRGLGTFHATNILLFTGQHLSKAIYV